MKKRIILTLMIIVILISMITNISIASFSINSADLYSNGSSSGLLKYKGIGVYTTIVMYAQGGQEYPAYCLNKDIDGVGEQGPYSVNVSNLVTDTRVWRAITNGYPYKSFTQLGCNSMEEAYIATKQAVYCMIYDRDTGGYEAIGEAGQRCLNALNQIVNTARNSNTSKISSELYLTEKDSIWKIDNVDKNCVYKLFNVSANSTINEYIVNLEGEIPEGTKIVDENNNLKTNFTYGENLKIIMPLKNITKAGNFTIKVQGKVITKPVLYGASGNNSLQDYALTASIYEDGEGARKIYYTENNTKIIITKVENETKTFLRGVKFNLLDENKNVIYTDLETNEEGKIEINNIIPGKYYIQETKTLPGYSLYDKLVEITVNLNETAKFNISNEKEEITVKKETTETETTVLNRQKQTEIKLPKTGM